MAPQKPKIFLIFLLALAVVTPPAVLAEGPRFDRGLLWRVEVPGAAPSWLFGTLHTDDDRVLTPPPPVERALHSARVVALEALADETSIRRFRAAMVTKAAALPGLVGEEVFARVDVLLRQGGIPREVTPRLKPWSALLVLLQPRGATALTLDNLLSLQAREQGKRLVQLESVDEQIAAFEALPQDTQLALLRHVAAKYDEIQAEVLPSISAYLERDLAALDRINAGAMEGGPDIAVHNERFLNQVLYARSERFAERLAPLLRQGGVIALFGALHLYGERGVPSLLQRQGFTLRRVY